MDVRPATNEDLETLAEIFASVDSAVTGRPSPLDAGSVRDWLQGIPLETNTWLIEEDGTPLAAAFAQLRGGRGVFAGAVRPPAQGRGFGGRLVELAEARLAEEGAERFHGWSVGGDRAADELFGDRGYREVRRFWDMAIELDDEIAEPDIAIDTFREEDAAAFHAALEEAFAEHWEHRPESFDEWWSRQRQRQGHDPSAWFLVRDGKEIAAVELNIPELHGGGYVAALGVRPPWRGRGYGRALLLHSFREFRRRGIARASLGVDAANATGATRLYERVGMYVEQENVIWEKPVR